MKLLSGLLGLGRGTRKIEWILPYIKDRAVLDIGCAGMEDLSYKKDSWLHGAISKVAKSCTGLDCNSKILKKLTSLGYNIVSGDAQKFKMNEIYDVVVAGDLVEHLEDINSFFNSIRRALKDDGYLIITTPNPWFFPRIWRCVIKGNPGVDIDHTCWYCTGTLKEILRRNGFEVVKMEYGSSEPFFYYICLFRPVLFHTSIFVAAKKIKNN